MFPIPDGVRKEDYGDVMVDIETTGLVSGRHGVLQIAAVRFDLLRGWIGDSFQVCLDLPGHLHWEEGTREWWLKSEERRDLLVRLVQNQSPWQEAMERFHAWVGNSSPTFWSKPTHFDFPFLQSYFADAGLSMPFHYRKARDLNTWISARYYPNKPRLNEYNVPAFEGFEVHNALHDCLHQVNLLMAVAMDTGALAYKTA